MTHTPSDTTVTQPKNCGLSRRDFLRFSTIAAGSAAAFLGSLPGFTELARVRAQAEDGAANYPLLDPANQLYSVCLQCNTGCGIKVKILDGVAAKIDGNPFHPMTMYPHIPYETPVAELGTVEGALCPKGQAGLQTVYDPYRLVSVLKRKPGTPRGANQWETIAFEKAIEEIVEGGDLFGEGNVPGLRDSYALTDSQVAKDMIAAIKAITAEKDPAAKQALVEDFKTTFADHLDKMIDPNHPDLGPRNNQFVFMWGRLKSARKDFISRFLKAYGTTNAHGHTTVCQGSLYFSGKAMSERFVDGTWTGGSKFYWQGDIGNSEFVIFVGASPFEANYGPPLRTPRITTNTAAGTARIVVVDPRFSKTASKAWKWLPNIPGSEGALALAMIQWIIANQRYDGQYLSAANAAAASLIGEPTWTEATWLVKLDADGNPTTFLRASEIGLREKESRPLSTNPDKSYDFDYFVAMVNGQPVPVDPYARDPADAVRGDLLVNNVQLGDFVVKSGLQIIADSANEFTLEQWSDICGIAVSDIIEIAAEFTNHGKRAVADVHRGVSQHTNGFYNVVAWYTLNALIGNYDYAGGLVKASTFKADGSKKGQPFKLSENATGISLFGTSIIRHGQKYESHTLFLRDGYPAKRNWYPLASDVYQEVVPSIGDAYPYSAKALMLYMGSPIYSLPAGHTNIEILADPQKLPLFIAIDPFIGETSMYADYIFPDTMYLERWEFHGSHPSVTHKIEAVRNPTIVPMVPDVTVFGQKTPLSLEAVLLGIAERLGLKSFGPGGFGAYGDLVHPDEFYLKMVANLAFGEKEDGSGAVPDADEDERRIFLEARRHLPDSVFNAERWQRIVGDLWPKVIYVLNRGGRFDSFSKGYTQRVFPEPSANFFGVDTEQVSNVFGTLVNIYQEKTYQTKDAMQGKHLAGYARYIPAGQSVLGEPIDDESLGYDLHLITYKVITQTKSRTASNYWLLAVLPENTVEMNTSDAAARGLNDGDLVRISSASNPSGEWNLANGTTVPMIGKVKTTQGLRPGVVAFGLGFGHWSYGGVDFTVDDVTIPGDPRRVRGFHANAAMRVDPYLGNTTLVDPVGGSAVFYDTKVKVEKI